MSDADEPLPPGADEEEEAPPGTEQSQDPQQAVDDNKPQEATPAAQLGADYANYYAQDPSFYAQQYAYSGYYGQGYPEAAAGKPLNLVHVNCHLEILFQPTSAAVSGMSWHRYGENC